MSLDCDRVLAERIRSELFCRHGFDAEQRLEQELALIRAEGLARCWLALGDTVRGLSRLCTKKFPSGTLVIGPHLGVSRRKRWELKVGPGLGSGVSSAVSYGFGISEVDPILNGLLFEEWYTRPLHDQWRRIWVDLEPEACPIFARQLAKAWVRLEGPGAPIWGGPSGSPTSVRLVDPALAGGCFEVGLMGQWRVRDVVPGALFQLQHVETSDLFEDIPFAAMFGMARTVEERRAQVFEAIGRGEHHDPAGLAPYSRRMGPTTLNDLAILAALVRPDGKLDGEIDQVISCKQGKSRGECPFPVADPILAETYGHLVFSEQAIRILSAEGRLSTLDAARLWHRMRADSQTQPGLAAGFAEAARVAGVATDAEALFWWVAARAWRLTTKAECMALAMWAFTAAARAEKGLDRGD